jgi:hypothetical protein
MERRCSKFHAAVFFFRLAAPVVLAPCSAWAAVAGCDAGKWPLSAVQTHFGGTLPALGNGATLPALGAPALVNLSLQSDVAFPHPPGRTGKADPAYAAVIKLGAQPAGAYQITVSDGAWIDVAENNDLAKPSAIIRPKDCPGIDKSIRFKTSGGPLAIEISGSYAKTIKVEAARAE